MKKYGVVLVGCGHIGREHIESIYDKENINIVAVVDTDYEKAKSFFLKYNAEMFGCDYKDFVALESVDIVIIATNVSSHLEIFKECVKEGKHVLCEKPIATNISDGKTFYDIAENANVKVLIAHILRFNESYRKINEMIQSGAIGKLQFIKIVQNHHLLDFSRHKRLLEDCTPVLDCGVHYFDLVQWFTKSNICKVSGVGKKLYADIKNDNYQSVLFETKSGCIGSYEVAWSKNTPFKNVKEFVGEKGYITLTLSLNRGDDSFKGDLITYYNSDTNEYSEINLKTEYRDMYAQFACLIDMIENNTNPMISLKEVMAAFNTALKANEAIAEGKVLTF